MAWTTPKTWETNDFVTAVLLNTHLRDNLTILAAEATRGTRFMNEATIVVGTALVFAATSAQIFNLTVNDSYASAGASFTLSYSMAPGTYTLSILGTTGSNLGKIDWKMDGVSIATGQDWYSGSTVNNVIKIVANVVITAPGVHVLTGTVNGKHASSSGYYYSLTAIWFK